MSDLTAERLRELLHYDPETGIFMWAQRGHGRKRSAPAGFLRHDGYRDIKLGGRAIPAHQIAWVVMTGCWPPPLRVIDHINGVKDDNRWVNLRLASHAENARNRRVSRAKRSALPKGVTASRGMYRARICLDGRMSHVGYFATVEDAEAAYAAAELNLFGPYARAA